MFSHVTVGTNDLARAIAFYDTVLTPLGLHQRQVTPDGGPLAACWVGAESNLPRFYVYSPLDGLPAGAGNGGMVAFKAPSTQAVDVAHAGGMSTGGTDEGTPGLRPRYGVGYYGAYLRDPDGNKIHIVHRGDLPNQVRVGLSSQSLRFWQSNHPHENTNHAMNDRPLEIHSGSCHCEAVRFEIVTDFPELTTCDCSICRRKNALMVKVHASALRLVSGEEVLSSYQFHTRTATHYFCRVCGIYPFHRKRISPDYFGVNVYCIKGFNPLDLPVRATAGSCMP